MIVGMTSEEAIARLKTDIYQFADFSDNPNENEFWEAFDMAINALRQKPEKRWIPISVRLPKKTGMYLVSIGDLVSVGNFDGHHFRTRSYVRFVPDAWLLLPPPYKESEE